MESIYKLSEWVEIPTSELSKQFGKGKIVEIYGTTIAVDFQGHIGKYTVSNHEIKKV